MVEEEVLDRMVDVAMWWLGINRGGGGVDRGGTCRQRGGEVQIEVVGCRYKR